MKKENILKKIDKKARVDAKNRNDIRFKQVMGFLVAKGFLKTNIKVPLLPNKRLRIKDAIWAGLNVEPRILEVLPAATLRLEKHFDLDKVKHANLARVVGQLRYNQKRGDDFLGVPYKKLKVWTELVLKDGRVKTLSEKKILKNFRLRPETISEIKRRSKELNCSETEVLERLVHIGVIL